MLLGIIIISVFFSLSRDPHSDVKFDKGVANGRNSEFIYAKLWEDLYTFLHSGGVDLDR